METTWKPTTAGILTIIGGGFNLIVGIILVAVGTAFLAPLTGIWSFGLFGTPLIVLGAVSVVGGIFAIQRKVWGLALAGAICALFPPPIAVLGILSIIFVSLGKVEFTSQPATN